MTTNDERPWNRGEPGYWEAEREALRGLIHGDTGMVTKEAARALLLVVRGIIAAGADLYDSQEVEPHTHEATL
jgi:hypothetical protein